MSVLGIDFGNDNCVIAVARRGGIDMACNQCSNRATPTVVGFGACEGESRSVGERGKTSIMSNIRGSVLGVKRYVGRSLKEPSLADEAVFQCAEVCDGEREVRFKVQYNGAEELFEATGVCAMMFQDLRAIAELECNGPVLDCVIGVPGYWSDRQRRALHDAATSAGLKVLRLLSEPTAAAVAYGCNPKRDLPKEGEGDPMNVMIMDMGHSNFQCSLCQFVKGKVTVLGTVADPNFGCRNFDNMLVTYFANLFKDQKKIDILSNRKAKARLLAACEKAKMLLSANSKASVNVECIMDDTDVNGAITRDELEEMARPLLERAIGNVQKLMSDLGMTNEQVHSVEMIGGGTRIPCVENAITDVFGKERVSRTLISSEPVARGCALQAAMISPAFKVFDFTVQDVVTMPVSLCWKTAGAGPAPADDGEPDEDAAMDIVEDAADGEEKTVEVECFSKGSANPAAKVITFHRKDTFEIQAEYKNQEDLPEGCDKWIGKFTISGIPASETGESKKVKVKARLTPDGVVSIDSADMVETTWIEVEVEKPKEPEKKEEEKKKEAAPENSEGSKDEAPPAADNAEDKAGEASEAAPTDQNTENTEAAPDADATPMDTEDAPKEPEKKRKKKTKKTPLNVEAVTWSLSKDAMEAQINMLLDMEMRDKLIADTLDRKNAVESYVYETRDAVDMHLKDFVSDEDRTAFKGALDEAEDWLYGDGENCSKSSYIEKLAELRKMGDPIELRHKEAEKRPPALAKLQEMVTAANDFVVSDDEKYAHIEAEDRKKVADKAAEAQTWMNENVATQEAKPKTEPPLFMSTAIEAQTAAVQKILREISTKPKPKPKEEPKPEPTEEAAPAADGEAPAADGEAPKAEAETAENADGTPDNAAPDMDVDIDVD